MPRQALINLLYKHGTRRESTGNKADPTVCNTWNWSMPFFKTTLHFEIQTIWDVELKYAIGTSDWKRISYGHETRWQCFVQDVWGRLEDKWREANTFEDDDWIKGWH